MSVEDVKSKTNQRSSENDSMQVESSRYFFSRVYQKYGPLIFFRCQSILGDSQEAADALQDIFVKIMSCWKQYDTSRELLPWVLQITTNHCIDCLRKKKLTSTLLEPSQMSENPQHNPYEQRELLISLLGHLDPKTQSVVLYYYLDGFTHSQTAKILQISEKTVLRRLRKFNKFAEKWRQRNLR